MFCSLTSEMLLLLFFLTGCRQWLIPIVTHNVSAPATPCLIFRLRLHTSDLFTKDFVPLSSSSCALLQGTMTVKFAKQEGFFSAGISFQTVDLPVTSLSPQLSATFTTAAIMQNNLISHLLTSPTSTNCPTPSPSPERNPSGLFTCSPCCLTQSCSWHPVVFNLFQVCFVPC